MRGEAAIRCIVTPRPFSYSLQGVPHIPPCAFTQSVTGPEAKLGHNCKGPLSSLYKSR
ncbi:uncharacterized protein CCOS01_09207 [Colletotrichum costaricense]|uniref:Uncharacterized protein n=1 Tax=Colletotrichum costaricense TaxID=1209916 RepID=A0AAI9YU29_9PEZI|nr:uncharacterized protein CCOS01_09207 [Colletotrichum costaricense]KAK1524120.1 hypothetical protein CCOS01_09207 [Colletotrichum costaricense]